MQSTRHSHYTPSTLALQYHVVYSEECDVRSRGCWPSGLERVTRWPLEHRCRRLCRYAAPFALFCIVLYNAIIRRPRTFRKSQHDRVTMREITAYATLGVG